MKIVYRPTFDRYHVKNEFTHPYTGIFNPGETYYWRVRARSQKKLWGQWSSTKSFRWIGPGVPTDVKGEIKGREIWISWKPNSTGAPAVRYEVYASDERGFTVSKERHNVVGLGEQPTNFVAETDQTQMLVVSAKPDLPNKTFYRIVAVDGRGTRSGSSGYVELPHPFVYSEPPNTPKVGAEYRYQPKIIRSLGDLQHRPRPAGNAFWEKEEYAWDLAQGPPWLKMDEKTGCLSGVPSGRDIADANVEIHVKAVYPHEVKGQDSARFAKTAKGFQRSVRQSFVIKVLK